MKPYKLTHMKKFKTVNLDHPSKYISVSWDFLEIKFGEIFQKCRENIKKIQQMKQYDSMN